MDEMSVQWAGLNHLALITNDMDRTTRFWHGVLGAPLVATIGTEAFRHYFFDVGQGARSRSLNIEAIKSIGSRSPQECRMSGPYNSIMSP
jgi:catechol 2,3-dioxygenase-like lactoylglutathione lyase family enzyme